MTDGGKVSAIVIGNLRLPKFQLTTGQCLKKGKVNTIVPLTPSSAPCPFTGALHLPRLWLKVSLEAAGQLAAGYPAIGKGYDIMTLNAIKVTPETATELVRNKKPTYPAFVRELKNLGADFSPETIKQHNAAISGYNHDEATVSAVLAANGLTAEEAPFKDACTVNFVDDLKEFHTALNPAPAATPEVATVKEDLPPGGFMGEPTVTA